MISSPSTERTPDEEEQEENGHSLPPVAVIRQSEKTRSRSTPKRTLLYFGIALLAVVVIITVAATAGTKKKNNAASNSEEPTSAKTIAPNSETLAVLKTYSTQGGAEFDDPTSYQYRALVWVDDNSLDYTSQRLDQKKIIQRYALACIYFATFQVETPYSKGKDDTLPGWRDSTGWMTTMDECQWFGVTCHSSTQEVIMLDFKDNGLTGRFPPETAFFEASLQHLDISGNILVNKDQEMEWIGKLRELKHLDFSASYMDWNGIPNFLGELTLLTKLIIGDTLLDGPINAPVFEKLSLLRYLDMSSNTYSTTIPSEIYLLPKLEYLYITDADISGDLEFITNMTQIVKLWLDSNRGLEGTIPTEIGMLSSLASLSLSACTFTDSIPTELGLLTQLENLWLYDNDFSGTIPTEMAKLSMLDTAEFQGNDLSGKVPATFCTLTTTAALSVLAADCDGFADGNVECSCCTCCAFPCPIDDL